MVKSTKKPKRKKLPASKRKPRLRASKNYTIKGKLRFKRKATFYTGNTFKADGTPFLGKWENISSDKFYVFNHPSLENLPNTALSSGTIDNGIFEFNLKSIKNLNNLFMLVSLFKENEILVISSRTVKNTHIEMNEGQIVGVKVDLSLNNGRVTGREIDLGTLDVADPDSEKACMMYYSICYAYNWCKENNINNISSVGKAKLIWPVNPKYYKRHHCSFDSKKELIWVPDKYREDMEGILHEFGHFLHWRLGQKNNTGSFNISYDWEYPYEERPYSHCLVSEEFEDTAFVEGFAHFFSLVVRNSDKMFDKDQLYLDVKNYKPGLDKKTKRLIIILKGRQVPATVTSILLNFMKNNDIDPSDILEVCFKSKSLVDFYDNWKNSKPFSDDLKNIMIKNDFYYRLEFDTNLENGWMAVKETDLVKPPILLDTKQVPHVKMFSDVKGLYKIYGPFGTLPDDIKAANNNKEMYRLMGEFLSNYIFPREFHNINRRHNKSNYKLSNNLYLGNEMPTLNKKYIVPVRKPL